MPHTPEPVWTDAVFESERTENPLYRGDAGPWPWMLPAFRDRVSTRLLDATFGCLTMFRMLPGISAQYPISDLAGMVFIAILVTRRPRRNLGRLGILIPLALLLLAYLILVSMANDVSWVRRSFHLAVMVVLALLVGQGRADLPSLLRGAAFGFIVNAVLFYAGLAPDSYGGFLTGYLEDKNRAAMVMGVVGLIICGFVRRRYVLPCLIAVAGALWLTGSRTTMAGFAVALVWILLRPKMTLLSLRLGFAGFGIAFLNYVETHLAHSGVFADRTGTDALRQRIDDAVALKLTHTSWLGGGLGTATVDLDGAQWFFHNSYDGLRQEGGWVFFVAVVALYVWLGLRPSKRYVTDLAQLFVEAATIVELVAAWKLGEVFLANTSYVLLGAAILLYVRDDPSTAIDQKDERLVKEYARRLEQHDELRKTSRTEPSSPVNPTSAPSGDSSSVWA